MDANTDMRILIVEDEPDVRDFLMRALAYAAPGANIEAVGDAHQALSSLASAPVDLVISDYHMPRMSGIDLLNAVRSVSMVPFVLISADRSIAAIARDAGASRFLSKPLALHELRTMVLQLMLPPQHPLY